LRSNPDGDVITTSIGEIFFKYISVAGGEPILTAKDEGRRKIQCHTIRGSHGMKISLVFLRVFPVLWFLVKISISRICP